MIGLSFTVSDECSRYSVDLAPHKVAIKQMAGSKVTVTASDNNGTIDSAAYKIKDENGNEAWAWKRELL